MEKGGPREKSFAVTGPPYRFEESKAYRDLVQVWARASRQMSILCVENGIRYLHVLQPNQYDTGSKPLSEEEQRTAINPRQAYRYGVEAAYPMLREAGKAIAAAGVDFHDFSKVFIHHRETLYVDDCCHVGKEGYDIVARTLCSLLR
jgi:hypothetical protein